MKFGIAYIFTDESITPAKLAIAAEERSFDSLWAGDHSHVPASRETPFPHGGDLPREFYRELDIFSTLSVAAAVTSTLTLGTGVVLAAQRDVFYTAKQAATLDLLSQGRFIFGVGAGWINEQMRNHGIDPRTRGARLSECLAALKEIWSNDEAEFHGKYIDFDPIYSWPKPVQPRLPIYVGGEGVAAVRRVNDLGDAWMPNAVWDPSLVGPQVDLLKQHANGKEMVAYAALPDKLDVVEEYLKHGVEHVIFWIPTLPEQSSLTALDALADNLNEFR